MIEKPPRVWGLMIRYWLLQPIAVLLVLLLWVALFTDGDLMYGDAAGQVGRLLLTRDLWLTVLVLSGIITAAQVIYLWPARKPGMTTGHGRSLRLSVTLAGLLVGLGGLALTLGVVSFVDEELSRTADAFESLPIGARWMLLLAIVLGLWAAPTVVIMWFCRSGRREDILGRLANRILLGTAAEALILIPLDAMIRRRTDCYCAEGSFIGLTVLGMIGFVGAGPAVLLPLFAKRRRGWCRTHCNACGYDMSGNPDRCPECGRDWKTSELSSQLSGGLYRGVSGPLNQAGSAADHPQQSAQPDGQSQSGDDDRNDPVSR